MREKAVRFGEGAGLVGILTGARGDVAGTERPAIIFLNSGILHRIGACRLHVRLARELSEHGFTGFRFDHSGIGDSLPRKGAEPVEESSVAEVREAMNYLERVASSKRFILFGLCSGADMAFQGALRDERVVGLVQLDPWCYPTLKSRLRYWTSHYAPRLLRADVWARFMKRWRDRCFTPKNALTEEEFAGWFEMPEYIRKTPPREEIARDTQKLIDRGVEMLLVFSGGAPDLYNYREQYEDSMRGVNFRNRLQVEHLPDATHIFTRPEHQEFVIARTRQWVEELCREKKIIPEQVDATSLVKESDGLQPSPNLV